MKARIPYKMSCKQKQIMNEEVKKQLFDIRSKSAKDIDTMLLWILHTRCGFGEKRLKEFFHNFVHDYNDFRNRYEMKDTFPEQQKLKEECNIDIDELYKSEGLE